MKQAVQPLREKLSNLSHVRFYSDQWRVLHERFLCFIAFTSVSQLVEHYHQVQRTDRNNRDAKPSKKSMQSSKNPEHSKTPIMFSVCASCYVANASMTLAHPIM